MKKLDPTIRRNIIAKSNGYIKAYNEKNITTKSDVANKIVQMIKKEVKAGECENGN